MNIEKITQAQQTAAKSIIARSNITNPIEILGLTMDLLIMASEIAGAAFDQDPSGKTKTEVKL